MTVSRITVWQTTDGQFHKTKAEADTHEARLADKRQLEALESLINLSADAGDVDWRDVSTRQLAVGMLACAEQLSVFFANVVKERA